MDATLPLRSGKNAQRPLAAIVRVLDVPAKPSSLQMGSETCRIGKAPDAQIVVTHPSVSRAHVSLELVAEGVLVTDLGSTNGTFYMGQRVERIVLGLGARFRIGAVEVAIDAPALDREPLADYAGDEYRGAIGAAPAMKRLFAMLERLEGSLATVLLEGESGVGKEVIARAIHDGSKVASGPYVTVNCGALARELVASELFGHRKGAFTGANEARKGAFDTADGGTLFLDEIGELPMELQPALLRALESGEIRPVGSDAARRVKVRIVAATNRDLAAEVRAGRFREDLFFRLAVVRLRVPPLRDRPGDIPALAQSFATANGLEVLPSYVIERLKTSPWSGNVRELRNAIQSYAALGILPGELDLGPPAGDEPAAAEPIDFARPFVEQRDAVLHRFTVTYLEALLEHTEGNQSEAARLSGLDRAYLGRLIGKYNVTRRRTR